MSFWPQKVDKNSVVQTMKDITDLIKTYEKYEFGVKYLVPNNVHAKIVGTARAIKQTETVKANYDDMKAVYDALAALKKTKTLNDSAASARAYGKLISALSAMVGKLPTPASMYASPLKVLGDNFEKIVKTLSPSAHGSEGLDDDFKDFLGGGTGFINGR